MELLVHDRPHGSYWFVPLSVPSTVVPFAEIIETRLIALDGTTDYPPAHPNHDERLHASAVHLVRLTRSLRLETLFRMRSTEALQTEMRGFLVVAVDVLVNGLC
jgi:hypothetical protein